MDVKGYRRLLSPFEYFGRHALVIYVLHIIGLKLQFAYKIELVSGQLVNLKTYLTMVLFGWAPENLASLLYAISYVVLCFAVALGIDAWTVFVKQKKTTKATPSF